MRSYAAGIGYRVGMSKLAEVEEIQRSSRLGIAPYVGAFSPLWGGGLAASAPELQGYDREKAISHIAATGRARSVTPAVIGALIGAGGLGGRLALGEMAAPYNPYVSADRRRGRILRGALVGGVVGGIGGAGLGAMPGHFKGVQKAIRELEDGTVAGSQYSD